MCLIPLGGGMRCAGQISRRSAQDRHCGRGLVEWFFVLITAAYNFVRIPKMLAQRDEPVSSAEHETKAHRNCACSAAHGPSIGSSSPRTSGKTPFKTHFSACWYLAR